MSDKFDYLEKKFDLTLKGMKVTPRIIQSDIDDDIVDFAVQTAVEALEKYSVEKELSTYIKEKFDESYNEFWHVVVGEDFSVSLTHNSRNFIFFKIEKKYYLIFRL